MQSFAPVFQVIPGERPTGIETANAVLLRNPLPQDAERCPIESVQMVNSGNETKQNIPHVDEHVEQHDHSVNHKSQEVSDSGAMSSCPVCTDDAEPI